MLATTMTITSARKTLSLMGFSLFWSILNKYFSIALNKCFQIYAFLTCHISLHPHPSASNVEQWPGRSDHPSKRRWSERKTLLKPCTDPLFGLLQVGITSVRAPTWPHFLTSDSWFGSRSSASAIADNPEMGFMLDRGEPIVQLTEEAAHLCEPYAVLDCPRPAVWHCLSFFL